MPIYVYYVIKNTYSFCHLTYIISVSCQYACRPCGQDGCNGSKISDCLVNLPEEKILQTINKMLTY